jgi:hypothetical protein
MQFGGTVYILANKNNTVLYIGVTSDLFVRILNIKINFIQLHSRLNIIAINLFIMKLMQELKMQLHEKSN